MTAPRLHMTAMSWAKQERIASLLVDMMDRATDLETRKLRRMQLLAFNYGASLRRLHTMAVKAKGNT